MGRIRPRPLVCPCLAYTKWRKKSRSLHQKLVQDWPVMNNTFPWCGTNIIHLILSWSKLGIFGAGWAHTIARAGLEPPTSTETTDPPLTKNLPGLSGTTNHHPLLLHHSWGWMERTTFWYKCTDKHRDNNQWIQWLPYWTWKSCKSWAIYARQLQRETLSLGVQLQH